MVVGGGTAAALGVVALAGTAAFGSLALMKQADKDAAEFQDDAQGHLNEAVFHATLANVLLGTGVVLVAAGAGVAGYSMAGGF